MTTLAAGLLFLDGVLLILAGVWTSRAGLIAFGILLVAAGFGVIVLWRRWRRVRDEIASARRELWRGP